MAKSRPLADVVREAVDRGATTVEEIHKAIAELPLEVLEKIDGFEESARAVRRLQDESISAVYDLIRKVNRKVGDLAKDLVETGREAAAGRRSAPKRKAAKPAARRKAR